MKKILPIILTVVLTSTLSFMGATPVLGANATLEPMVHYSEPGTHCGPCSGTSIGGYYKSRDRDGNGLGDYPALPNIYPVASNDMYHRLDDYMDTDMFGATDPSWYGPGFVEMALHYGYDNFSYVYYADGTDAGSVTWGFYDDVIKNAIDNGWPVALFSTGALVGFQGVPALPGSELDGEWPCPVRHVIAIKGYYDDYLDSYGRVVVCTDSFSHANNLYLDWEDLWYELGDVGFLQAVIIKDVDTENDGLVENFEWGSNGTSLEDWQNCMGEVDWEVGTGGSSVAEIETDPYYVYTGTRSARFRKPGTGTLYAYYDLLQPSSIGFRLKKDSKAIVEFSSGDGSRCVRIRINSAGALHYAYGGLWRYVCTIPTPYNWHFIELRNINWGLATYDIYVDYQKKLTVSMSSGSGWLGRSQWLGSGAGGTFWIDGITDSLY